MQSKQFYRKLFDLSGKVALVTGGVGILGKHFCAALADHGATVIVVDLDEKQCSSFAKELTETFAVKALGISCDLTNVQDIKRVIDKVENTIGSIDILHNNAASKSSSLEGFLAPTEDYTEKTWREVMAVNADGAFFMAQEVGKRMADRGRGSIIQTASIYGIMAPDQRIYEGSEYMGMPISSPAVYAASKAAIIGLTKYLAAYWGEKGVRVNTLTPGGVESGQNDTFKSRYSARVPLARMAKSDEMVGALIFLASDASSYITGQNIVVDGGLSSW